MTIHAYLNFDGNTRDAMQFYKEVLGGDLQAMMTFGETPACEHVPADYHNHIMHSALVGDGWMLMAADSTPMYPFEGSKGFSLALGIEDKTEAHRVFNALAEGGNVTMALAETFWAELFGSVIDRFGVSWLINCGNKQTA